MLCRQACNKTKWRHHCKNKVLCYIIFPCSCPAVWFYGLICGGFAGVDHVKSQELWQEDFRAWGVQPAKHPGHKQKNAKSCGVAVFIQCCSVHLCACCIDAQCCKVYSNQHSHKTDCCILRLAQPMEICRERKKCKYLNSQFKSPRKSNWTIYFGKEQ